MNEKPIVWRKRLAENQLHQSTWQVEADGVICIAKKIETDNAEKRQSLVNRLKRQVRFSEILNAEEQKSISLFDEMVETPEYVAFLRKYRDGDPLDQYLATRRSSVPKAVELMLKIARAVQIAHEHNVFHGDLKPANIIVGKNGEVSIIDWDTMSISDGVQKELIGPDVTLDQVRGTPQYMPIEQFQGAKITEQSDVYALGVILHQILTGETPFDRDCGTTPTEMAIYKQNHEPENILVKYPALGIPADLGKLIEEALKNDLNQRIPSVSLLISRLELVGKITTETATSPVNPPRPAPPPSPVPGEHKLVLIGHTGAGKTCLAAGLYATQDEDFAVEDPGSKTETGIHVINTRTILEEGHWPAATSVGTITRLKFKLHSKGREETIAFDEYAGERLEMKDFDQAIIKDQDGALILLNPGGAQWRNVRSKDILLSDMKHYIELLSKMPNHPPIALVITASDRLQSDLKEFAPQFQRYLTELENHLNWKKCVYKTFYVSVSGVLEDQAHPHLNPQGIKDPFLWLLENFTARKRRSVVRKIAIAAAIVAGILGLTWSGNCGREYLAVRNFREKFLTLQTSFNQKGTKSLNDLLKYRDKQLLPLRNTVCRQKHVDKLSRREKCSAACEPWFLLDFFREKFRGEVNAVEREIDFVNGEYLRRVLDQALQKPNEDNRKNAAELTQWKPLQPEAEAKAEELRKKYAGEMPLAVERFDANELEKKFRELIESKSIVSYPADVDAKYREWLERESVLPPEDRREAEERLRNLEKSARETVFQRGCTLLQSKTTGFNGNSVDDLVNLVNESKQFQDRSVPGVDSGLVSRQKTELKNALVQSVANFIDRVYKEAQKKLMASDVYEVPGWVQPVKERVAVLFPPEIRKRFEKKSDQLAASGKREWEQAQWKKIEGFLTKIQHFSGADALDELEDFHSKNNQNPYFSFAEDKVAEMAEKEFEEQWRQLNTEQTFLHLKEFCAKVKATGANTESKRILESKLYKFACRYVDWMQGDLKYQIQIHRVDARSTYTEGAYIYSRWYIENLKIKKDTGELSFDTAKKGIEENNTDIFKEDWKTIRTEFSEKCEPWQRFVWDFYPYETLVGPLGDWSVEDRRLPGRYLVILPARGRVAFDGEWVEKRGGYVEVSFDQIMLRIHYTVSGTTLPEMYREVFGK